MHTFRSLNRKGVGAEWFFRREESASKKMKAGFIYRPRELWWLVDLEIVIAHLSNHSIVPRAYPAWFNAGVGELGFDGKFYYYYYYYCRYFSNLYS